jgi:UPF0042 nucleotide-binding protein
MRLVVISGHSGSGKTSALNILEDVGFTCIDNLPVSLLSDLITKLKSENLSVELKLAVGIDARNLVGDLSQIPKELEIIQDRGISVDVLFLQSRRSDLLRRYSETRRKHPLSSNKVSLKEAIDIEKEVLAPIAEIADRNINTSGLSLHQLRDVIKNTVVPDNAQHMAILFESFGFKRGVPADADFVFDVRCLPNPHWKLELRGQTGHDPAVIAFLESQVDVGSMLADIIGFLTRWIPKNQVNNRSYLTIAIGCTGGNHRSVYMVNRLTEYFSQHYPLVQQVHKEHPSVNLSEN